MLNWLTASIGSRPLGLARTIVGVSALIRSVVAWDVLSKLAEDDVLRVPYADWVPEPTLPLAATVVAVWLISGVLFTIGWRVPLSGSVLLAAIIATLTIDEQTYSNHLYLMAWLLLLFIVADAGAGMNVHRVDRPVARWPVLLLMIQVSIVYGFSALTKINETFVSGAVLSGSLRGGVVPFPDAWRTPGFLSTLALLVIGVELFIAMFLWRRRMRPAAFALGLGLHLSITLLMASTIQLLVFSLEMLALYPLFLSTETIEVEVPQHHAWEGKIHRYDLLQQIRLNASPQVDDLVVTHHDESFSGFEAHTRVLEHLVPWLWLAPLLRLPGVSHLHQRFHERSLGGRALGSAG